MTAGQWESSEMDTGIMYSGEWKTGVKQLQLELSDYVA
jgi:hypothetical protein